MMKKKTYPLIALLMVLCMLAGCGGGSASTAAPSSAAETPAPQSAASESASTASSAIEGAAAGAEATNDFIQNYIAGKGVKVDGAALKVGMDFADLISEYVINLSEYTKFLLEQAGCEVMVTHSEMDVKMQDANIDDFISKGCDVVVIHAVDSAGSTASVRRLNDAGIPVICVIRKVDNVNMDMYVSTSNNVETGKKAMQYLADAADGAEVKIATTQGYMGASDAYEREEGFVAVIGANANLKYVSENPCEWDPQKAESAISDAFTANKDLWGIASHSDAMAPGIYSALRQADKRIQVGAEGHILWVSIDGAPYSLQMIREGWCDATIEQSPLTAATLVAKGILEHTVKGESIGGISVDVPTSVVTKENVDDPGLWGNYDVKSKQLWSRTEEIWNS